MLRTKFETLTRPFCIEKLRQMSLKIKMNLTRLVIIFISYSFLFYSAASESIVKTLPGYSGDLPFKLETGYVTVGKNDDKELFYYFIESERNPKEDPLILWLTGGPGCSGLCGLAFEIGPIAFDSSSFNGSLPSFIFREASWTKITSVIFIDQPVGTGFSYGTGADSYKYSDNIVAKDTYTFLRKCLRDISGFHILEPACHSGENKRGAMLLEDDWFDILLSSKQNKKYCRDDTNKKISYAWVNNQEVQDALHVRKGKIKVWEKCNDTLKAVYNKSNNAASAVPYHEVLTRKVSKAMVYSGDHDILAPYTAPLKWIQHFNLTIDERWRPWHVDGEVAGYTQRYTKSDYSLTYVTVKGAGHTAPEYTPEQCFAMLDRWINSNAL